MQTRNATLVFLLKTENNRRKVGLAKKLVGQGSGYLNGYGGKVDQKDPSIEHGAVRELREESGLEAETGHLEKSAICDFYFDGEPFPRWRVHIFTLERWQGEPVETPEMGELNWFDLEQIPFHLMSESDDKFLPRIFRGEKLNCAFRFGSERADLLDFEVKPVPALN